MRNITFNAIIRDMLLKLTNEQHPEKLNKLFKQMDKARGNSRGKKWHREELHRT